MKKIIAIITILLLFPLNVVFAATYWVSSTGAAIWDNCNGNTPLSGASACALSTANSNAVAGDTVYLREGTYDITSSGINGY